MENSVHRSSVGPKIGAASEHGCLKILQMLRGSLSVSKIRYAALCGACSILNLVKVDRELVDAGESWSRLGRLCPHSRLKRVPICVWSRQFQLGMVSTWPTFLGSFSDRGAEHIDLRVMSEHNIQVGYTPDILTDAGKAHATAS